MDIPGPGPSGGSGYDWVRVEKIEVPNTATEKGGDNVRNALIASGAIAGLSEAQWTALIKGLLSAEIGG